MWLNPPAINHHGGRLLGNVFCIRVLFLQSLYYEKLSGNGIGAGVAESVLIVTEILQDASSSHKVWSTLLVKRWEGMPVHWFGLL